MQDTDRVVRQTLPKLLHDTERRPLLERDFLDLTPTTAPSWAPPPPTRLARGTTLPPVSRPTRRAVPKVDLAAIGLAIRAVPTPRRWGRVVACDLDGVPRPRARRAVAAAPAALWPPIAAVGVLALALAILLGFWLRGPAAPAVSAAPETAPASPRQVTITPLPRPTIVPLAPAD